MNTMTPPISNRAIMIRDDEAGSSSDGEDYIFVGTTLDEEETIHRGQHRKDLKDPAATRSLPLWKQEVTDDQGRRRFHGAFTGGYSAGYFNTVGSKEGFTPATFRSSRSDRTTSISQNVEDFLDEDELQERNQVQVETKQSYDTFGFTSTEQLQKAVTEGSADRPQIIPGMIVKELVEAVADSWGVNLLKKMGWRQGRGIGVAPSLAASASSGSKWGSIAGVGTDNTPIFTMKPKRDRYGLCFDPYKGSEEFRNARSSGPPGSTQFAVQQKRRRGVAFGTGVLEDFDTYGEEEDYVTEIDSRADAYQEVASDEEHDDRPLRHARTGAKYLGQGEGPALQIGTAEHSLRSQRNLVRGFVAASAASQAAKYHPPPRVPQDFKERHWFLGRAPGAHVNGHTTSRPAAASDQPVPAPEDRELMRAADTLATFVAKNGKRFEDLARQRQAGDSKFSFLHGGEGSEYYAWRLKCLTQESPESAGLPPPPPPPPLNPEQRSKLLGEERLRAPISSAAAPKATEPAVPVGMLPRRGQQDASMQPQTSALHATLAASFANRFAASGSIQAPPPVEGGLVKKGSALLGQDDGPTATSQAKADLPVVRQPPEDWWPEPLLCKRFGVPDPHKGKERPSDGNTGSRFMNDHLLLPAAPPPPNEEAQRPESRDDPDTAQRELLEGADAGQLADAFLSSLMGAGSAPSRSGERQEDGEKEAVPPVQAVTLPADDIEPVSTVARPIDLFKAIFEDEEEDEDEEHDLPAPQSKAGTTLPEDAVDDGKSRDLLREAPSEYPESPLPEPLSTLGGALLRAQEIAALKQSDAQQLQGPSPLPPPPVSISGGHGSAANKQQYRHTSQATAADSAVPPRNLEHPSEKIPSAATSSQVLRILDALKGAKKSKQKKDKKDKKHKASKEASGSKRKSSDKSRKEHGKSKHSKHKKQKTDESRHKGKSSKSSGHKKKKTRRSMSPDSSSSSSASSDYSE